ncbi:MAG TPA: CoA transferase [Candidatus Methylomirabilis sp.]|jgi:crotonobetainyl-CoA:carnitine CoA-transferase CaiB-like acyl-CoA transferase
MAGPLAGVRVLDLTTVILGPFATQILAGLGAEVIKVESPEGDDMRHVVPMRSPGMGHIYLHLNRGKKSLVLDLKHPKAREALLRLVPGADVFISNIRPQALRRLDLHYEALAATQPRLIYVNCCGFSPRGPSAGRPAYDDLLQGTAGMSWLFQQYTGGEPGYAPVALADRVTGLNAAYAVCAALYAREKTGRGQCVDVPMLEAITQFILGDHMAGLTFLPPQGDPGYARFLTRHRRPYRTKDGYLCVLIYNDKQWRSFFAAIGDPEGIERDRRFSTHTNRAASIDEVYAWVAETMQTRTTAEWRELLEQADIPNAPMNSPADLLADPQLAATGFLTLEDHPTEGRMHVMGTPTAWSETPPDEATPAPRLGEHSAMLLTEAGYSEAEIRALAAARATVL